MSRTLICDHLITLLSAGHDTTSFYCCYTIFLLAKHPDIQEKVRREVNSVLQGRTEMTDADLEKMPYLRMVQQESLRLYAVIPFVMRDAQEDVVMKESGDVIPKGTSILIPMTTINRDAEVRPFFFFSRF